MTIRTLFLAALLLFALPAHASWHWLTVAKTGSGASMQDGIRPAFGTSSPDIRAWVAAAPTEGPQMLVLVRVKDGTGYTARLARLKSQGTYWGKEARGRLISATMRAKLVKEAKRLGAGPEWKPEDYSLGEEY